MVRPFEPIFENATNISFALSRFSRLWNVFDVEENCTVSVIETSCCSGNQKLYQLGLKRKIMYKIGGNIFVGYVIYVIQCEYQVSTPRPLLTSLVELKVKIEKSAASVIPVMSQHPPLMDLL